MNGDTEFKPDGVTVTDKPYFQLRDESQCYYCGYGFTTAEPGFEVNRVRREKSGVYPYDEGVWHRYCVEEANRENGY